ncbi:MAG: deoxyribodipyrimidine photo-lyase [Gemmatimonadales bacterium]|nr:deoxyribodipyrimidine photo-lyase [Gemmatimonadales bacterium]MYG20323.1 deoxyribodipyrimidine photo-lyase [Gemmatimonadales bacterium]
MPRGRASPTAPVVVWFRRDLRLHDNGALAEVAASGRPVVPLFVLDEESRDVRPPGGASRWWLHESLRSLAEDLAGLGLSLCLRRGPASDVLREVVRETGAGLVAWNRCYEPASVARDTEIEATLRTAGVETESYAGSLLSEPGEILTGQGTPYKVFTSFWKRLRECYRAPPPHPAPKRLAPGPAIASDHLDDWGLQPTAPDWAEGLRETWEVGEAAARRRLADFMADGVERYGIDRDRPDLEGSSRLSPHLHWGEIGPHQVWRAAAPLIDADAQGESGPEALLRELAWRDFSHHLLSDSPHMETDNWRTAFDRFPWGDDPQALAAWQKGRTGYPIVDAGMRELWHTGWMHNRVRMIAASFLTKDLLVHWRHGERWFWDTLVDADLANNVANWQWVAGSGADAQPFFRIFNPVRQAEKFDPAGAYVRRWVPEIARLSDRWLHQPWEAPPNVLSESGIELGRDYPSPIVDHAAARQRALSAYETMRRP